MIETDFCLLYESLERLARDRELSVRRSGGSWGCTGGEHVDRLNERFAIVSDKEKLPFAEKGDAHVCVAEIGSVSDKRPSDQLRTVKFDPDTGRLTPPNGIKLGGFRVLCVGFCFDLKDARRDKLCTVEMSREFSEKGIQVTIHTDAKDGLTFRREFLAALESKVKLARKLKEAREKRRQAAKSRNDGIDSHAKEPTPKEPTPKDPDGTR